MLATDRIFCNCDAGSVCEMRENALFHEMNAKQFDDTLMWLALQDTSIEDMQEVQQLGK